MRGTEGGRVLVPGGGWRGTGCYGYACKAGTGTGVDCVAMRCPVLAQAMQLGAGRYCRSVWPYAMCVTDAAYAATPCPVLM